MNDEVNLTEDSLFHLSLLIRNDPKWHKNAIEAIEAGGSYQRSVLQSIVRAIKIEKSLPSHLQDNLRFTYDDLVKRLIKEGLPVSRSIAIAYSTKPCIPMPSNVKENEMFKFETRQLVNGTDVNTMSEDELIDAIAKAEAERAKLQSIQTESKAITRKIKKINKFIDSVVKVLDSKIK